MMRRILPLVVSLAVASALAQTPPLVSLHVIVTDAANKTVPGLNADDFQIISEDRTLEIRELSSAPPLTALVMFDMTASMPRHASGDPVKSFLNALEAPVRALTTPDRLGIGTVTRQVRLPSALTSDRTALMKSAREALVRPPDELGGPSPVWDAVWNATTALAEQPGRRVVVLLSDGKASANQHGFESTVDRAVANDVAVFVIASGDATVTAISARQSQVRRFRGSSSFLEDLASATGGLYLVDGLADSFRNSKPGPLLTSMFESMRRTYVLKFTAPRTDGALHPLRIRVTKPGLTAHVRDRYQAPKD